MAVSSVVKTNFLKGEVDFSLWRRELETTREKIIPPAMRCIKKDRVVGVLWIKKINLQVIFCNLTLFLLKVRLIYISPFLRALLSRKKKDKKPKLKKVKTKKVFLRTNHIKMYLISRS